MTWKTVFLCVAFALPFFLVSTWLPFPFPFPARHSQLPSIRPKQTLCLFFVPVNVFSQAQFHLPCFGVPPRTPFVLFFLSGLVFLDEIFPSKCSHFPLPPTCLSAKVPSILFRLLNFLEGVFSRIVNSPIAEVLDSYLVFARPPFPSGCHPGSVLINVPIFLVVMRSPAFPHQNVLMSHSAFGLRER